jgi:hypothetical protein
MHLLAHQLATGVPNPGRNARRQIRLGRRPDHARAFQRHNHVTRRYGLDRTARTIRHDDARPDRHAKVLSLVFRCVNDVLKRAKAHAATTGHTKLARLLTPLSTERDVYFLCALDKIVRLRHLVPKENAIEADAVALRFHRPLTEHAIGLAAATRAAEQDLHVGARNKFMLLAGLRRPDDASGSGRAIKWHQAAR